MRPSARASASARGMDAESVEDEEGADMDEAEVATRETIEARIQAVSLRVRTEIILNLVLWKRDVMMCTVGADPELLYYGEEVEALRRQAAATTFARAADDLAAAQQLASRLNRNKNDLTALEAFFLGGL